LPAPVTGSPETKGTESIFWPSFGIAAAKERGVYQGGQKDGYRKASPERAKELRKTLKLTEIASAMNVSLATVKRYLKAS